MIRNVSAARLEMTTLAGEPRGEHPKQAVLERQRRGFDPIRGGRI